MISEELRTAVQEVTKLLFKAPVRGFVPKINWANFVSQESIPIGTQVWLESTRDQPENAIVQLIILSQDPLAHTRGEEPHPFIISKDHQTDGWQTASAVALEAAIKTQWPTSLEGVSDITRRPRLQTVVNSICEQTISGTKLAHLTASIQACLNCLSVAATTEHIVETMKMVCATAMFLGLTAVKQRALDATYTGLADIYAGKLELGDEARYDIANDLDSSGRYNAMRTRVIVPDNQMSADAVRQMKELIREKLHRDIESRRVAIETSRPSTNESDYTSALFVALHRLSVPSSITVSLQQAR